MEDQHLYKTHLVSNSNDSFYYQQMQHQADGQVLNHSYDSLDKNASESSSSSPHLSQDSRDGALISGTKHIGQVDLSRKSHWTSLGSGSHIQENSQLNCFDQSLQWSAQVQNDVTDGNQVSYYPAHDNQPKVTSRALHKLDSFTQVFARQNLRIHAMSQGVPEPSSLIDSDSTLRQLLSLKPISEQQAPPIALDRYPQVSQQMYSGLASQQQKHQLQPMQPSQSHIYYEYFQHSAQVQPQSLMQQGHQFVQQVQSHQALPQHSQDMQRTHYYMQHHQAGQQRLSVEDMKQQRLFSGHVSQYYQMHPAGQEMHHGVQQSHNPDMQLQEPVYNTECNSKADLYAQEKSHSVQLIQLGAVPQYVYQNAQPLRYSYKQSMVPQQQLQQQLSPQKPYNNDVLPSVLIDSPVSLPNADAVDSYSQDIGVMTSADPHPQALAQDTSYLHVGQRAHHSPNTVWPQHVSDGHPQAVSADNRLYTDRPESKSRLTCSVCFKEFKSLPALNGHLRSHGGVRTATTLKQEESEEENLTPIVMPVSVPVTLAPPEPIAQLNCPADQPDCSVSDDEMPILTRMTYSPPSTPTTVSSCAPSEMFRKLHRPGPKLGKAAESTKPQQERRKYRHRPEPLFIPPPSFCATYSGATLYQSQLRSPCFMGDPLLLGTEETPTYTPPPMLSPVRQGSGLFSSVITAVHNAHLPLTPLTPTPRVLLCRPNSFDGTSATPGPGEHTVHIEPRINIGQRFQAEIPDLQYRSLSKKNLHRATLVWRPWKDMDRKESQQKVEVFLSMSCSSVLPGGGTNLEYALHSLFEAKGDFMSALEMLLLKDTPRLRSHPLANYHYAGSDYWNNSEKKMFNKALNTCNKDFFHVQKMIKTKTVSQCVEYYYTWKKILHMGRRQRTRLVQLHEDDTTSIDDAYEEEDLRKYEQDCEQVQKSLDVLHPSERDHCVSANLGPPAGSFVCEMGNCGAIFCSKQALNGHARIHGGTSVPSKVFPTTGTGRQKSGSQSGYGSVKSSPAHSNTSGETDAASIFPCKVCGKVFYKIKSRNAHMKTHRQQEEQQRQRSQKAAVAAEMADTIAKTIVRTALPTDAVTLYDHFSLITAMDEDFDNDVAQDLEDVLEETEVMHSDLILDDEDIDLLQDGADL
ncbi:transcriptional-regulating factor 1 isoform X2 [Pseudophryne corroboree]|uniref:transcriptional-regulating factor 1 isoform X2 n=1 Tax=Pseudophryne corroboree TaxID=495146 RepID=UPI0030820A6E